VSEQKGAAVYYFGYLRVCHPVFRSKISDMPLIFGALFLAFSDPTPKSPLTWALTLFSREFNKTF
jgi:hypothetical protein